MKYRWIPRQLDNVEVISRLQRELNNLPEPLARVLVLRGIETFDSARLFFRPCLSHLHDPFLMRDMDVAASRVLSALSNGERVLIYGDYDVDGTTATALLVSFFRENGVEAEFFIPDRFEDGYGLNRTGLDYAIQIHATLVIAVDCGITAVEEAAYARERGIDLIICDHHTPDDLLPDAVAVLNPKRSDCAYPFKELSGCGVAFKLVQAVLSLQGEPVDRAKPYLDLVAVSTVSDVVPIFEENRVLMFEGLKVLRHSPRIGFRMLAEQAGINLTDCSTGRIIFGIGPRINAAGRMGDAGRAVELLLEGDERRASLLTAQLELANKQRRLLDQETVKQASEMADRQLNARTRHSVVLYHPEWHLGVVGIVASRLVERYYRPTIMLSASNGVVKGSARSIAGINVYDALKACSDLLITFGGHDYAAGLALAVENVPAFQERFDEVVSGMIQPDLLVPALPIDASLRVDHIDQRFWTILKQFEPHGPTNDEPVFHARGLEVMGRPRIMGKNGEHIKFNVRQIDKTFDRGFEVVGFKMNRLLPTLETSRRDGHPLELAFSIQENTWNGRTTLQLRAHDLRLEENGT